MFTHVECPSCKQLLPLGGICTNQRCQSVRGNSQWPHSGTTSHQAGVRYQTPAVVVQPPGQFQVPHQPMNNNQGQAGNFYQQSIGMQEVGPGQTHNVAQAPIAPVQAASTPSFYFPGPSQNRLRGSAPQYYNFGSAQATATNQMNAGYLGTMPQQPWNNNQGQATYFYQPFNPVQTHDVTQAPTAPVQAASNYFFPWPRPIHQAHSGPQYDNLGSAQSMATNQMNAQQNFGYLGTMPQQPWNNNLGQAGYISQQSTHNVEQAPIAQFPRSSQEPLPNSAQILKDVSNKRKTQRKVKNKKMPMCQVSKRSNDEYGDEEPKRRGKIQKLPADIVTSDAQQIFGDSSVTTPSRYNHRHRHAAQNELRSRGTSASGSVAQNPSVQQPVAGPSSAVTHPPVQPSKQILKVKEASRDARQNLERSGESQQQASASQGEDRNLHQRIGPVGNFGNVAQAQSAPVAAASSTSSYSLLGPIQNPLLNEGVPQYYIVCNPQAAATNQPNPQQNPDSSAARAEQPAPNPEQIGQNEASTSHGTSTSGSVVRNPSVPVQQPVAGPSSAVTHPPVQPSKPISKRITTLSSRISPAHVKEEFCLMCEANFENIDDHWRNWHKQLDGEPNGNYVDKEYETKSLLFYKGTILSREVRKCHGCKKVFYKHRYHNHRCPTWKKTVEIPNRALDYCLMCNFHFEDLEEHKVKSHHRNKIYVTRKLFEKLTLLPANTCDDEELMKCNFCHMPIYKFQEDNHQCRTP